MTSPNARSIGASKELRLGHSPQISTLTLKVTPVLMHVLDGLHHGFMLIGKLKQRKPRGRVCRMSLFQVIVPGIRWLRMVTRRVGVQLPYSRGDSSELTGFQIRDVGNQMAISDTTASTRLT